MSKLTQNITDLQSVLDKVNALPEAVEQVAPSISVNTSGLITATAGTKSSTHQLAFQPAKTITPTTASQIAVSSGYYTGGNVMVAGDSNLVAGNIKSGVSIFGVNGNYEGSGNTSIEDGLITGTLSVYSNDRVTTVGSYAFYGCVKITTVSFPAVTSIGSSAFYYCSNLTTVSFPAAISIGSAAFYCCSKITTVSFPAVTNIGSSAFARCSNLTTVSFPAATSIGSNAFARCSNLTTVSFPAAKIINISAFASCSNLTTVSFPAATSIGSYTFYSCYKLKSLYLTGSSVCTLAKSYAFSSTPIGGYSASAGTYGSIYVPASLLTSYQTATNWTYFSSRFVGFTEEN